jgi:sugar phosphate isomerase/epimerase
MCGHVRTCGTLTDFLEHPALAHVHLHDNSGNRDEHLALGRGSINLRPVLDAIEDRNISAALEQKTERSIWKNPAQEMLSKEL